MSLKKVAFLLDKMREIIDYLYPYFIQAECSSQSQITS